MLGVTRSAFAFVVCGIAVACGSANTGGLFGGTVEPPLQSSSGGLGGSGVGGATSFAGRASGGRSANAGATSAGGVVVGSGSAPSGGVPGAGGVVGRAGAAAGGDPGTGGTDGSGGVMLGSGGRGAGGATPTCSDGVRNQNETDIDCGGTVCSGCGLGRVCFAGTDCVSTVCRQTFVGFGVCYVATCADGAQNSTETDVDCGGGLCPGCANGKKCNAAADCASASCVNGACACKPLTCADIAGACGPNISDGCGGHLTCPACSTLCADGKKDGSETAADCGGPDCKACTAGAECLVARDCQSGVCKGASGALTCKVASCTDTVKNGAETDVDCGGATCPKCETGRACKVTSDCQYGSCDQNVCSCTPLTCDNYPEGCGTLPDTCGKMIDCQSCAKLCSDGTLDGHETDVDCGGPDCNSPCPSGATCVLPTDCQSGTCDSSNGSGLVCQ